MNVSYRKFELTDAEILEKMILDFYVEDAGMKPMSSEKVQNTIKSLTQHPDRWAIIFIEVDKEVIWYSLLINFWSNEYGGNLLNIDEIYIKPSYRWKWIWSGFIKCVMDKKFTDLVGIQLEVTPENDKARNLYTRLGFESHKYEQLTYDTTL